MFYDVYCDLCKQRGLSPSRAALDMGINKGTVSIWKKGIYMPRQDTLQKIAKYFNVPVDYLLGNETHEETPALTKKDERDIAKDLEELKASLENSETLMFDGDPMTPEARESILAAMKLGLEAAKVKNKEKYTPKKYKGG